MCIFNCKKVYRPVRTVQYYLDVGNIIMYAYVCFLKVYTESPIYSLQMILCEHIVRQYDRDIHILSTGLCKPMHLLF